MCCSTYGCLRAFSLSISSIRTTPQSYQSAHGIKEGMESINLTLLGLQLAQSSPPQGSLLPPSLLFHPRCVLAVMRTRPWICLTPLAFLPLFSFDIVRSDTSSLISQFCTLNTRSPSLSLSLISLFRSFVVLSPRRTLIGRGKDPRVPFHFLLFSVYKKFVHPALLQPHSQTTSAFAVQLEDVRF